MIQIKIYKTRTGKIPYSKWRDSLDFKTAAIIIQRIDRVIIGNFGDCKPIKGEQGLYELRIQYGPGYRVYFGKINEILIILLAGGDKGTQDKDIAKAKAYWLDYKGQKNE